MGGSAPKPPKATPEEIALEKRTEIGLRQERARTERMLKAQARGKLGAKSLLKGIKPDTGLKQEDVVHSDVRHRKTLKAFAPGALKRLTRY